MKTNKILSFLLALIMLVGVAMPTEVAFAAAGAPVTTSDGYTYTVDDVSGEATITGYTGTDKNIVIPDTLGGNPVTAIGNNAFRNMGLTGVTLPNTLVTIGEMAFCDNSLQTVVIPDSVTTIVNGAFSFNSISSLTLGTNVKTIGIAAFHKNNLNTVVIPDGVVTLGTFAFKDNGTLRNSGDLPLNARGKWNVVVTTWVKEVYTYTTTGGVATIIGYTGPTGVAIVIPNTLGGNPVKVIGAGAFFDKGLTGVTLPNTLENIGERAFKVNSIVSVTIPDSVIDIRVDAFAFNSLSSLTLGNNVKTIGVTAFYSNCLQAVTIPSSVTAIENAAFSKNGASKNSGSIGSVSAGTWNVVGGEDAPWEKASPYTYTTTGGVATIIGYTGPTGCAIVIPTTLGGVTVTEIGNNAFSNMELTGVTLPNNLETIGEHAFTTNSLTSIIIPNSVTTIEKGAFAYNYNLSSLTLGTNVDTIGASAFFTNSLQTVVIPDSVTTIGNVAFENNKISYLTLGNNVKTIGVGAFQKNKLNTVVIPNSVTTIGALAFQKNGTLGTSGELPIDARGQWNVVGTTWVKEIEKVTIAFNTMGAGVVAPEQVNKGEKLVLTGEPIRNGYKFIGWYTSNTLDTPYDFQTVVNSNMILYAKWEKVESTGGGSTGGGGGSSASTSTDKKTPDSSVSVNGQKENAGKETKQTVDGKVQTVLAVDTTVLTKKIDDVLKSKTDSKQNLVELVVGSGDKATVQLTGDIVKKMETDKFDLSIKKDKVEYLIPASEITIDKVAGILAVNAKDLKAIAVDVKINEVSEAVLAKYTDIAKKQESKFVVKPVEFEIVAKTTGTDGKVRETTVSKFTNYVERVLAIPEGVAKGKITTGVVFNPDGTFSHVPTDIFLKDGKYYAKLNSLTNSTYSVIENPIEVTSVKGHWSEKTVNDMASRLVLVDYKNFEPNKAVTRAEFADYIVRALGIYREGATMKSTFKDVAEGSKNQVSIQIASDWGIISGYPDGTFKATNTITRQEAMTMYAKAMDIAKILENKSNKLATYTDKAKVATWATPSVTRVVNAEIFNGKGNGVLDPKGTLTEAESLTAVRNLLLKAELINE